MTKMDGLLCKLLWIQLNTAGFFTEKEFQVSEQKKTGLKLYERWFEETIKILEKNNYLMYNGESYIITNMIPVDIETAWEEWEQKKGVWLKEANFNAQVVLVEATLRALPEILTGKRLATDVIFPGSSMQLVEGIYKDNLIADYFNEVIANTVVAYFQERIKRDSCAKIRILEIGAGTGGSSAAVFEKLKVYKDNIKEYCYTDISKVFLMHAEKEYGPQNPYLTYKIFDIQAPIADQGIVAGGYDIVIAANVLHATRNIRQTLRNTKAVLKKNGLILLSEMCGNSLFSHLTFGLLEGWWLYEDSELRISGCPGLTSQTWKEVLESEGFHSIFFPVQEAHDLGQYIIVGVSDGIIRQKQQHNPAINLEKRVESKKIHSSYDVSDQMAEDYIREIIIAKLSEALKVDIDLIGVDKSFADYGLDSILGIGLVKAINQSLLIELEATSLFDYSSVNELTKIILSKHRDVITATLGKAHYDLSLNTQEKIPVSFRLKELQKGRVVSKPDKVVSESGKDPIAIIGVSGRFAKSKTLNDLWEHLSNGRDLIEEVSRWDLAEYYTEGRNYCKYGSFLDDIDQFDPLFFNISGLEATYMDPQQRLFLEESWKALEDAGYAGIGAQECRCGVYVGFNGGDYHNLIMDNAPAQAMWGNAGSVIPARIAYYLNLQGPAVTIDTACSSSLVSIHLACQGLWTGETDMALAGGVFVQCTPGFYINANRAEMLSPTGRCHTFDERADGFVPGEGVGVVVLKCLRDAVTDGDHIYGVIRGSGINQDGTTNGITAPSAKSQERLERYVYDTFNINPEHIQMVEAHGTGTRLGDPIEYEALTRSFRNYTDKKEYCAIGTIKTNIGHTAAAAGVAGVIKILLSIKHKKIPPSLHFQSGNSNIQFKGSPFYVNTSLKDWDMEQDSKRCAVASAFGFSGTNAHMVIEEAPEIEYKQSEKPGYLIVLSACTKEQLRQQVEQLVGYCEQEPRINCGNMSYTLLMGRKHFNHRLACVVQSQNELITALKKWLKNGKTLQVYVSTLHDQREQPSLKRYGNQCIQNCLNTTNASEYLEHLSLIADLYVQGYSLEFEKLFSKEQYSRISLPTYPFARERYWVSEARTKIAGNSETSLAATLIHPLLHVNTSDLLEQRFSSSFTGEEFFFADHVVNGDRILPGVAYLEMARMAVEQSAKAFQDSRSKPCIKLKNVIWARPVTAGNQLVRVHIGLYPEDNREIAFEIYSESKAVNEEAIVHSRGIAVLSSVKEAPTLDIEVLKTECAQNTISSDDCYKAFLTMGINYGLRHQGIEKLYLGPNQVLAKLSLPNCISDTQKEFILHPSLMDSALQASIGLFMGNYNSVEPGSRFSLKPRLPFAMQELEILGKCSSRMWAMIQYSKGSKAGDKVEKLDIDLSDETGKICVRVKGLTTRVLEGEVGSSGASASVGTLMLQPDWTEQAIAPEIPALDYTRHLVILCELGEIPGESIQSHMNGVYCITLNSNQKSIDERFGIYVINIFKEIQNILRDKPKGDILVQVVVPNQGEQQLFSGLSGILKTAWLENPKLMGQLIEIEPEEDLEGIIQKLKENSRSPLDNQIRYQEGKRLIAGWSEVKFSQEEAYIPWQNRGIYLITGGAGCLGIIFAKEIAHKVKEATLILTGRTPLDDYRQTEMKELHALGARSEYRLVDVTRRQEVIDLIQSIREQYGGINGIIHSAGLIRDNYILKKTSEELQEVMAPKISGLVNLDEATRDLSLDFFVLFSSITGSLGNPGQADYSAANAFMDAYARYRNHLVASSQRRGQTISINWPLWKEGGMRVDKEIEQMLTQSTGMLPMETATGIRAFYQALSLGKDQVFVMEGVLPRMRHKLLPKIISTVPQTKTFTPSFSKVGINTDKLLEKVQSALMQEISELLKVKVEEINAISELNEYGFDSITFTQLTNKLNEEYKLELTPTIFFEYPTLRGFAEYLLEEHHDVIETNFAEKPGAEVFMTNMEEKKVEVSKENVLGTQKCLSRKKWLSQATGQVVVPTIKKDRNKTEPIAIVGMTGRFPMAKDINQFWRNLKEGKDCITEIPKKRWDWQEYYGNPLTEVNKTNIKWGGFIEGADEFDPLFFGISPKEAEYMDPQHRLLMIYVWKVIEEAGYSAQSLSGTKTGLFVGSGSNGYSRLLSKANIPIEGYSSTGIVPSMGPNRMSYFLNIHGPSEPIETACSSSLVAIHRAVSAMENESCEMAIAGGINTILTPEAHISFSKAGMLCEDGRCKTFSNQANGYVRGEGIGMIFLKKLKAAEEAGDHIYGIIRGTAENHGGRANSLTAPNPKAQAELLIAAYSKAGIDPRTVSYIETHGTGTELGDPIEVNGIKAAFKELYGITGESHIIEAHCGLGSVKTNIGHLEIAAGIAGVIKVLLQFKHKTLVKSLHCETLNPYIRLENSPFYLVRDTQKWIPIKDPQGIEIPRRAGVSSFGFGGTNAHVVLEEYLPEDNKQTCITVTLQNREIIILSAKNEERLSEKVQQLLISISEHQFTDNDLADIAYTLQVGRDPMEERLAVIVGSINELELKFKKYLQGENIIQDLYRSNVKRNNEVLDIFAQDQDSENIVKKWVKNKQYAKIANLWVKGFPFDWNLLHNDKKYRRLSLPTYSFAREHYWVPEGEIKSDSSSVSVETSARVVEIHPLLHKNTSNFSIQRFSSIFTGQEFFIADHVIKGERVLPGAAYLEMARKAVEQAVGDKKETQMGIQLKNLTWLRPLVVDEPVQVDIELFPEKNGEISYEIYGHTVKQDSKPLVYCHGSVILNSIGERKVLDIEDLQRHCNQRIISAGQCYEAFRTLGFDYGPAYRGIEQIYVGHELVLAKLSLPLNVLDVDDEFIFHPSMIDAAFQASIGLTMGGGNMALSGSPISCEPTVPFAMQELEIFEKCLSIMWALVRFSDVGLVGALDIDLCDEFGKVCIRIKGLATRVLESKVGLEGTNSNIGTLMLQRLWNEQAITREAKAPDYVQQLVFFCELDEDFEERLELLSDGVRYIVLQSKLTNIGERFEIYATRIFEEIQNIFNNKNNKLQDRVLIQIVVHNQGERNIFSGLCGLLKTARMEHPNFVGQLIEVEPGNQLEDIIERLKENSWIPVDNHIRYKDGERWIPFLREINVSYEEIMIPWQDKGIYLLTGGFGGLGRIFATEIARKVREPGLILAGRSPLSEDKQAQLNELKVLGARVEYKQVDVTQKEAVFKLIQSIREEWGNLNGIIHCAGIIRDNFITKKTKQEVLEVLAPKVRGLVNLDQASREMPLDLFVLFSSMAGSLGNPGQVDYSTANAFMDAYCGYRNTLIGFKQRHGKTLSINWPLWKEGGMRVDDETLKIMIRDKGIFPLTTLSGIRALYESFASGLEQVIVVEGNVIKLKRFLGLGVDFFRNPESKENVSGIGKVNKLSISDDLLRTRTLNYVKQALANTIKIVPEQVQPETPFTKYGIDSITQVSLIRELEKLTGMLPKTILFECSNVQELVEYLIKNYSEKISEMDICRKTAKEANNEVGKCKTVIDNLTPDRVSSLKKHRFAKMLEADHIFTKQETEDVAIIGISGRYPLSDNLEEFWEHLKAGHNCITEVPDNRWKALLSHVLLGQESKHWHKNYYGGYLNSINRFDHHLFEVAAEKVWELPPELRLFLEIIWETFEDAGYTKQMLQELQTRYQKGVGVFVGTMYSQYSWSIPSLDQAILNSNQTDWQIPNQTSHFFNLTGPSIAVNSACSSSLTAIHLACESLKQKSCSMAIAGGVNLTLEPSKYESLQRTKFLGSGNKSKSFGAGDGYIPGEGVGAVLLKPLSLAVRDNDRIYGVIKSSFVNHSGGRQRYTAPDPKQQTKLILESLQRSGIDPLNISYVECAANGSELGDSLEVISLNNAFRQYTKKQHFCALGSVKSNVGHLEAASGICQLSKVLLQLKHQTLVPTINANPRNPNIRLEGTAFYLQEEIGPWNGPNDSRTGYSAPRRSMINSFGAGGAYANLIVEEFTGDASVQKSDSTSQREYLFVFSAKTEWSLLRYLEKMINFLESNSVIEIDTIARSLQKINHALEHRAAVLASSVEGLLKKLKTLLGTGKTLADLNIYISSDLKLGLDYLNQQQPMGEMTVAQLAEYWTAGAAIKFTQLNDNIKSPWINLPKYVFEHKVEFDFPQENPKRDYELTPGTDEFYLEIARQISNGELSEDEVEKIILKNREEIKWIID